MSGLTGLIDTLLAAKLSQRLDVLAIKSEAEIAGPGPVIQVQKVDNDVRLLSNAALDRQIAPDAPGAAPPAAAGAPAAQLSVAARAIGALLAEVRADAGPVRGTVPVWPSAQAAPNEALASTLAHAVAASGLFYESHLAQFAAGSRTLAQLAQEPQARWSAPAAAAALPVPPVDSAALPVPPVGSTVVDVPVRGLVAPVLDAALPLVDDAPVAPTGLPSDVSDAPELVRTAAPPVHAPLPSAVANEDPTVPAPRAAALSAEMHAAAGVRADAARVQATYRQAEAPATGSTLDTAASLRAADAPSGAERAPATSASIIHPQALALVHQQLDLLATTVFRWSGQAWPGVPMEWSIHEDKEGPDHQAGPEAEAPARRWTTKLSLSLPSLGVVDVRLSLRGDAVQAQLTADEISTRASLRTEGPALARRLEDVGLRLQELQIAQVPPP
jgi:hypothetical protein